jgi:hypothetical protein
MQNCRNRSRPYAASIKLWTRVRFTAAASLLIVGVVSCSSAGVGGSHADAVKRWRNQAQPAMDRMNDALVWFEGAVKKSDYDGAHNACRSFGAGVDSLERQLPTPDDDATGAIREAVSQFRDFGGECLTVDAEMTQDEANHVVSLRDQGIERIKAAVDIMDRIEHQ